MSKLTVEEICESIIALTDEDYAPVQAECDRLKSYSHPLRHAATARENAVGEQNQKSLDMLKALQQHLKKGEHL